MERLTAVWSLFKSQIRNEQILMHWLAIEKLEGEALLSKNHELKPLDQNKHPFTGNTHILSLWFSPSLSLPLPPPVCAPPSLLSIHTHSHSLSMWLFPVLLSELDLVMEDVLWLVSQEWYYSIEWNLRLDIQQKYDKTLLLHCLYSWQLRIGSMKAHLTQEFFPVCSYNKESNYR